MQWRFGPFRLDLEQSCLWHGAQRLPLRPKTFDLLVYLVRHAGELVSKEALLEAVWPETSVAEGVLTTSIGELRKALRERAKHPQFIATVHRRGYRFVAPVTAVDHGETAVAPPSPESLSVAQLVPLETVGVPVSDQNEMETAASAPQPAPVAERRQLTVLFCDVVRSTAIAEQLDPEDLQEVLHAYRAACTEVIGRFDGYVAQFLGDGVLVYFGYPHAHEDAARRAVLTGLSLARAMAHLNGRLERHHGVRIAIRIGIHTGLVVMGNVETPGRVEPLAVGVTPTIASRLQGLAAPDTVVVSAETYHLVQGYFTWKAMGVHPLPGVATPPMVYQVLQESDAQTRLEAATARSLTPFVGREAELTLLQERWGQVQQGMGHVVLLNGEAGIGKSRLVRALGEVIADVPHTRLEYRCSPYHQHTLLYPVIELIHRTLEAAGEDPENDKIQRLERLVQQCQLDVPEGMALLASLLALPLPADRYAPLQLSPQQQRQRTLETLLAMVLAPAAQQPVLLIIEDVHWADPSTLEWLGRLLDQGPTAPILTLITCRPTFQAPWSSRAHVISLTLQRLSRQQVEQMVQAIVGAETVPTELVEQVVTITDGVPLFVEEVTKLVVASQQRSQDSRGDAGAGARPAVTIPTTLQDSLMARLDAVGVAKQTAQLGATIGRQFSHTLLQSVSSLDATTLQQHLGTLLAADLLYQRGVGAQTTYVFKHALIQEAAYASLLRRTRQAYHRHIAQSLEEHFPDIAVSQPELLAHHYVQSEAWEPAFVSLYQAGEKARQAYANLEAMAFYTQAIDVSRHMTPGPEAVQLLAVYEGRGLVLMRLAKIAEALGDFHTVLTLARTAGNQQKEGESLCHLALAHTMMMSEDHVPLAKHYAQEALRLSQRAGNPYVLAKSLVSLGVTETNHGNVPEAEQRLEEALRISRQEGYHDTLAEGLGHLQATLYWQGHFQRAITCGRESVAVSREIHDDFNELFNMSRLCLAYWSFGEYVPARDVLSEGLAKAKERGNTFVHGRLLNTLGWFHREFGDVVRAVEYDHESMELGRAHHIANVEISALINLGYDYLALGQYTRALSYLEPTLERVQREGLGVHKWRWRIRLLVGLAELAYTTEDDQQALRYVAESLKEAQATASQKYVALSWVLQGKIAARLGDAKTAGGALQNAWTLAEQLHSPSLTYPLAYELGHWYERLNKEQEATAAYGKAQAAIARMVTAVEDDELRSVFLQSTSVQSISACAARLGVSP